MEVKKLNECGYAESLIGISLSRNQPVENMHLVAKKLAHLGNGHSKFLESIFVWLDINAPRFFWQEFSTYRVGISAQSESTIYCLTKKELDNLDFEYALEKDYLEEINNAIDWYNNPPKDEEEYKEDYFIYLKNILPEGFLQRRIVCVNYKCLQNIYNQRKNHKLPQWKVFLDSVLSQVEHPEFIHKLEEKR